MKPGRIQLILAGFFFSVLWASASAATKIGLQSAQPFVIAVTRFLLAGIVMLVIAHMLLRKRLPEAKEWKQLAIYGLLNISIYLGLYVIAMQNVSAGLGSLSVGTNPVFISIMSAMVYGEKIKPYIIVSLLLCMAGITIAALPLVEDSYATPGGLTILLISMLSYSFGAVYFSRQQWNNLHMLVINGWQTLMGGIFLLPFLFLFYDPSKNSFDIKWAGSVLWLVIFVSIAAVQLWLLLLKDDPVKAAFWLFLCPVFGFILAALLMHEPLSLYTLVGVILVLIGLYLVQKAKKKATLTDAADT